MVADDRGQHTVMGWGTVGGCDGAAQHDWFERVCVVEVFKGSDSLGVEGGNP